MAFTYTGGATNSGSGAAPTITHGQTINEGDLVVIAVHSNNTGTLADDGGGLTEAYQASEESNRYALYYKTAGVSEPSAYNFTSTSAAWRVIIKVFGAGGAFSVDSAVNYNSESTGDAWLKIGSSNGRTVSADAVSIIAAFKDDRTSAEDYDVSANNYVSPLGATNDQQTAMAHRIWTSGGTDVSTTIKTTDGNDASPYVHASLHMSFVEDGASTFPYQSIEMQRRQMKVLLTR